jgi:predicted dinucleotide-binding enzyme
MSDLGKTIAIIGGTGALGSALAFRWGQSGYKIILGFRY